MTKEDQIEVIAEAIWQGESMRAADRERRVAWYELGFSDQESYRFVARHVYDVLERASDLTPRQYYEATR